MVTKVSEDLGPQWAWNLNGRIMGRSHMIYHRIYALVLEKLSLGRESGHANLAFGRRGGVMIDEVVGWSSIYNISFIPDTSSSETKMILWSITVYD